MTRRLTTAAFGGAPTQREDLPLPTSPPYTCFVGGLAFESTDSDLSDFFSDLNPSSVRLVKDVQGKAKGFGYVEFGNVEDLKSALQRSGASLGGRTLRISVAEAREFDVFFLVRGCFWLSGGISSVPTGVSRCCCKG